MEFLKFEETRNFLLNRKRLRVDYIYGGGSDRGYDFQKQLKIGGYSFLFAGAGGGEGGQFLLLRFHPMKTIS